MSIKRVNLAFTLAEVLITLGIIGVIAAITIPTLMNNINEQELKTAWKKEFSVLNQAFSMVMMENDGSFKGVCTNSECVLTTFGAHLRYTKTCSAPNYQECWHTNNQFYDLNKSVSDNTRFLAEGGAAAVLNDGSLLYFVNWNSTCTQSFYGMFTCGGIMVDVNGFKKPNTVGKDIFGVHLLENSVKPFGTDEETYVMTNPASCISTGHGGGCSAKYLYD